MTVEGRALLVVVAVIATVGIASAAAGIADLLAAAALFGAGSGWAVFAAICREWRIRRRLADTTGTRPAGRRRSGLRVGPGEHTPAPPATNQPGPELGAARPDTAHANGHAVAHCPSVSTTTQGGTTP